MVNQTQSLTVVTVCKNDLSNLRKTYESIEKQKLQIEQWIVVDGKSTDGTVEWLKEKKINYISESDSGIYDAMNKGWRLASGEYIHFLNAGDVYHDENCAEKIRRAIAENNSSFIAFEGQLIRGGKIKNLKYSRILYLNWLKNNYKMAFYHPGLILSRKLIESLGGFNRQLKIAADYELTLRAKDICRSTVKFESIFVMDGDGISQANKLESIHELKSIQKAHNINIIFRSISWIRSAIIAL